MFKKLVCQWVNADIRNAWNAAPLHKRLIGVIFKHKASFPCSSVTFHAF